MGRKAEQRETRERVKTADGVKTFKKRDRQAQAEGRASQKAPTRQHETGLREHEDNDEIQLENTSSSVESCRTE